MMRIVFALLIGIIMLVPPPVRAEDEATATAVTKEIETMETKLALARRGHDEAALDKLYADDLIDVHASGWIYNKQQSFELDNNTGKVPGQQKQIRALQKDRHVVVFDKDAAAVVWVSEIYYEVPDPEEEAVKAGVLTQDPAAVARAKREARDGPGSAPGEGPSPNPYRTRTVRIWLRIGGEWKVASSSAAKIGPRVVPGRFE
jgi:hypothetical protein